MPDQSEESPGSKFHAEFSTTTPTREPAQGQEPPLAAPGGPRPTHSIPVPPRHEARIDKEIWGNVGNPPAQAGPPQLAAEVVFLMEIWSRDQLRGRFLWGRARLDFDEWEDGDFNRLPGPVLKHLLEYLYANGVWIDQARSRRRSTRLAEALMPPCHIWNDDEIQEAADLFVAFNENLAQAGFREMIAQPPRRYTPSPAPAALPGQPHAFTIASTPPEAPRPSTEYIPPEARRPFVPLGQGPRLSAFDDHRALAPPARRPTPPVAPEKPTPRMIADLAKQYDDDMKWNGELYNILDAKLAIFNDCCDKAGILPSMYAGAFSTMLKGRARDYYYEQICPAGITTYSGMVEKMRAKFETQESRHAYLAAWRETTLAKICQENPEKSTLENLEALIDRINSLARALGLGSDLAAPAGGLRMHLLSACNGHPACRLALYNPAPSYDGVVAQLRSAVATDEATAATSHFTDTPDTQFITDRTYRGNGRQARYGAPGRQGPRRVGGATGGTPTSPKKCYVCGKTGCWSTNHPKAEQDASFAKYRAKASPQGVTPHAFTSFLTWHEGPPPTPAADPLEAYLTAIDGGLTPVWDAGEEDDEEEDYRPPEPAQQLFISAYFTTPFDGQQIVATLANHAAAHGLTKATPGDAPGSARTAEEPPSCFSLQGRYTATAFQGIMPDTGAAKISTAGHQQFAALQREIPVTLDRTTAGAAQICFGPGDPVGSLGTTTVPTPLGPLIFHVVPTPTPFLLCLKDMDANGILFDNLANVLRKGDLAVPVLRKWGHAWMPLRGEDALAYAHLTETELRRLHRRFGHPSVSRLHRLLTRAGHQVGAQALEGIERICRNCQLHAPRPGRFKFTLHDDREFNYEVYVDIFYLEDARPVLHVVDAATSFNAARFLPDISASTTWAALRACWIDTYQGPPDWIVTDAGKQFHAAEFHQAARALAISVKEVPVEAHNSIGAVERYHAPLRRAYEILRKEDPTATREASLQTAVKAVNDSAGPDGLTPTLLVFGAYPRILEASPPSPATAARAAAINKAMAEVRRIHARRQVASALATRNGPSALTAVQMPLQSKVRVWREKKGWQGPYPLLAVNGEDVTIGLPHGPTVFRSTVVKPWHDDPADCETETQPPAATPPPAANPMPQPPTPAAAPAVPQPLPQPEIRDSITVAVDEPPHPTPRRGPGRPRKNPPRAYLQETDVNHTPPVVVIFMSAKETADFELAQRLRAEGKITTPGAPFEAATQQEIDALIDRGVFEFTIYDPRAHGRARIFKSRIVNEVKNKATNAPYEKSRLVVQGYADAGKEVILTQAPTIQRASQRLILALTPTLQLQGMILWIRDITQAYVQSATPLNRAIYAALPKQIKDQYPQGTIMKVVKPLYGIAEAGTHWWATYNRHHRELLQMEFSTYDPCLLLTTASSALFGCVGMQTDDTLGLSTPEFSHREDEALTEAAFTAKPKSTLAPGAPLAFNGGVITLHEDGAITLRQKGQGQRLAAINLKAPAAEITQQYVEQRARAAYIASICQPEACFDLSSAAQRQEPKDEDIKALNRRLEWQLANPDRGLTYVPLDLAAAALYVFVDGSFANNPDMTSQLGFVIVLANEAAAPGAREASPEPTITAGPAPTAARGDTFTIRGNIIHYSSTKCKRVTRSVLASEVYGMVAGVDIAYTLATTLAKITGQIGLPTVPTIVCTDSYSLYECLVKLGTTKEKRLMIDILALRQSYERRELYEIRWINGEDNPADAFTKVAPNKALERLVSSSELEVRMEGWVARG